VRGRNDNADPELSTPYSVLRTLSCRLLPYAVAGGAHNMAADEVLLEAAAAGVASLRLYGWTTATVSLGYFQPERVRLPDERLAALPFVRRPSGGGTLVHHHEITYALGLPAGPPWQTGEPWLTRMHGIVAAALARLGVVARPHVPAGEAPFRGFLCFQHVTAGDLLLGPGKVVGSAQRRHRGALMQHGALLLAASPFAPVLPGVRDLCGRDLAVAETRAALEAEFARQTGWALEPAEWTDAERGRRAELTAAKYGHDAWNRKR
jgi:lipoate-protein ligase A